MTITHFSDGTWMTMTYRAIDDNAPISVAKSIEYYRELNYAKTAIFEPLKAAREAQ